MKLLQLQKQKIATQGCRPFLLWLFREFISCKRLRNVGLLLMRSSTKCLFTLVSHCKCSRAMFQDLSPTFYSEFSNPLHSMLYPFTQHMVSGDYLFLEWRHIKDIGELTSNTVLPKHINSVCDKVLYLIGMDIWQLLNIYAISFFSDILWEKYSDIIIASVIIKYHL